MEHGKKEGPKDGQRRRVKRRFLLNEFQDNDGYTKSRDFTCVQCTLHVGIGGGHKRERLLQLCCNPAHELCNKSDP